METTLSPPSPAEIMRSPPLEVGVNEYCAVQADIWRQHSPNIQPEHIRAEMEDKYKLLEPVNEQTDQGQAQPAMTVCIPVALMREEQSTIDRVLDTVYQSATALGQPVEVVLWTNTQDDSPAVIERYQHLRDSLHRFDNTDLQIKTALQTLPQDGASISQIRGDYMEAATIDALENGRDSDHPILWLDADTTYLSSNTLGAITDKLEERSALFVHATEKYTTEWADGLPVSERDFATRAVMVHEIHRRKYAKKFSQIGKRIGYPEESGLAFTLGTYLKLGGVNTQIPVDEAATLLEYAKELVLDGQITHKRSPLPQYRPRFPQEVPGVLEYIPAARLGLSARRQHAAIKEHGANGVRIAELRGGNTYTLHSNGQAESVEPADSLITRADMRDAIAKQKTRYTMRLPRSEGELDEKHSRIISRVINKEFDD